MEGKMAIYGYARVSTRDQDLAGRDAKLMAAGCAKVFKEKVSGAKTDRPELAKVIGRLWLTSRGPTMLMPPRSGGLRHRALSSTPWSACEKEEIGRNPTGRRSFSATRRS
jgi:Resolvase, N terminal domain